MKHRARIIYWIATIWLALGMLSTAVVQLIRPGDEAGFMTALGYPLYVATLLGAWKLLGVIVILIPGYPRLKEWAYAGFFFAMSGAAISHLAVRDAGGIFPSLLLLALTVISWYFRPADRKLALSNQ